MLRVTRRAMVRSGTSQPSHATLASSTGHRAYICIGRNVLFVEITLQNTNPDSAVAKASAKGLVGTGFASRYRLQPRAFF